MKTPSIHTPGSIRFAEIQESARDVLAMHRHVESLRDDYDPNTDDWRMLVNLSTAAARLAHSLPVEMLPPEEVRVVSEYEYRLAEELLAMLGGGEVL
ncbi:hypothetical protein ACWDCL_01740 [Streptomyces sp. NPDC001009]